MGKAWVWIKSLSWVAIAGAIVTAVLMVLGGAKSTRLKKRADHAEKVAENLIQDKTKKNIDKAAKLTAKAERDKTKAAAITKAAEKRLEELGAKDETMADVADRFNKRKLRDRAG